MLMNTGTKAVSSEHRTIDDLCLGLNGKVEYALEGSIFVVAPHIQLAARWPADAA